MMLVYDRHYRDEKHSLEIDIEEFLTLKEASGIYTVKQGKYSRTLCAINSGTYGPNEPIRALLDGTMVWDIDVKERTLTKRKGNIMNDADKITERVVFEGSVEDILREFENKNYRLKNPTPL